MEIEEAQAELQALLKLYALHRRIGDGTGIPESSAPYLDERARALLKDLLDKKWETTLPTYSELITTAQPNQSPPTAVVPKRQCRYCQQRSLKRQVSMISQERREPETKNQRDSGKDSKFMEVVHLLKVLENGRKVMQPKQVFVHEIRSVASTTSNSSSSSRIRPHQTELKDSRRFGSGFSYSSWTTQDETCTSPNSDDSFSSPESSSSATTESVSENSSSSYSIEKPVRTPIRAVSCRKRKGDKIGAFRRIKNRLGLVFHHHHHHHHHGGRTSMWRHVKEMLRQGGRRRSAPDEAVKKGKRRGVGSVVELLKQNKPNALKKKTIKRKKRLHWWQLKRRTEAGRNRTTAKKKKNSRTTINKK